MFCSVLITLVILFGIKTRPAIETKIKVKGVAGVSNHFYSLPGRGVRFSTVRARLERSFNLV